MGTGTRTAGVRPFRRRGECTVRWALPSLLWACSPVAPENAPPQVALTDPPSDHSFVTTDTLDVRAQVSDPDGAVVNARLYVDGVLIGTDDAPPYSWRWVPGEGSRWHSTVEVVRRTTSVRPRRHRPR